MFRTFLLIFSFCGLTAFSIVLEYKASADPYDCQPLRVCVPEAPPPCEPMACVFPDVQPPACELPICKVERPLVRRWCAHSLQLPLRDTARSRPQLPCFLFREDKLNTVARVSTADIMRAISR